MSKKLDKSIEILEKRIRTLKARLDLTSKEASFYHEINEEYSAMKRILDFVREHYK